MKTEKEIVERILKDNPYLEYSLDRQEVRRKLFNDFKSPTISPYYHLIEDICLDGWFYKKNTARMIIP